MATLQSIVDGIQILAKYDDEGGMEGHGIAADHDIIYVGPENKDTVSGEDQKALDALGWHVGDYGWARFV